MLKSSFFIVTINILVHSLTFVTEHAVPSAKFILLKPDTLPQWDSSGLLKRCKRGFCGILAASQHGHKITLYPKAVLEINGRHSFICAQIQIKLSKGMTYPFTYPFTYNKTLSKWWKRYEKRNAWRDALKGTVVFNLWICTQ